MREDPLARGATESHAPGGRSAWAVAGGGGAVAGSPGGVGSSRALPSWAERRTPGWTAAAAATQARSVQGELRLHALTWLVVANAVGLLLATLLLVPRLGDALGPLTYGRWVPVHLDLQLYGWCSLPLVGLLLRLYLPAAGGGLLARLAVRAWSASLAFGAIWWLAGRSSGKLFLEWSGPSRLALAGSLALLAAVLVVLFARQLLEARRRKDRERPRRWIAVAKGVFLLLLLAVPAILYLASSPAVYPPVNPDSSGATGGSLLGSTLGIVAILWVAPLILGLRPAGGYRGTVETLALLLLHFALFGLLDHGDHSNHEPIQILALSSLLIWWPLLTRHLRRFEWPAAGRRWCIATAAWGAVLLLSGVVAFLPGVLESWKFTNALVGHAHAAMAGLVTSFNVLVLIGLAPQRAGAVLGRRLPFWLWHLGCGAQVAVLIALGTLEGQDPGLLMRGLEAPAVTAYAVRWLGGLAMLVASGSWLAGAWRSAGLELEEVGGRSRAATAAGGPKGAESTALATAEGGR